MKEIAVALIGGLATLLAAWISSKKKRRPNEPEQPMAFDRPARYVAFFAAGTVVVFALMLALPHGGVHTLGLGDNFPVGTIVAYMGKSEPEGWLFCDGRPVGETHSKLKSIIGETTP